VFCILQRESLTDGSLYIVRVCFFNESLVLIRTSSTIAIRSSSDSVELKLLTAVVFVM